MQSQHSPGNMIPVPIIGQIAAGEPIPVPSPDIWDNVISAEVLDVAAELTRGKEEVYALRVKGSSMVDALIDDGDIVLLEYINSADNGDTVVAWLKGEKEVTLKKFYREQDYIRLEPANNQMEPIYTPANNVQIQGRVIAVIRVC